MEAMERLPENQREALRLKFQHGLSYKEIGRVTEESVGNVGWLIHTGLKKLREGLGSEEWKGIEA
jgi:RNA polymerase sigma-70 factor (ECF subfamily)